jgi:ABC-type sulfate/molybdate transport systems ATPase subunit
VALARTAYAQPDVALLDDPFSALDPKTAASVFEALLGNERSLLRSSTGALLVTHSTSILDKVNSIVVLSQGHVEFSGTWAELQNSDIGSNSAIEALRDAIDSKKKIFLDDPLTYEPIVFEKGLQEVGADQFDGTIMAAEEREFGLSSWKVWSIWLSHAGGSTFLFIQIFFLLIDRGMNVASDW